VSYRSLAQPACTAAPTSPSSNYYDGGVEGQTPATMTQFNAAAIERQYSAINKRRPVGIQRESTETGEKLGFWEMFSQFFAIYCSQAGTKR